MLKHSDGARAYDWEIFPIFLFHAFCNRFYDIFHYYELVIKMKYYDWIIAIKDF